MTDETFGPSRRDVMRGSALVGLFALSPSRLAAASFPDGQGDEEFVLRWPDLGSDWTDGLPVANGQLGAMVWVMNGEVVVSVDRADAWDMRRNKEFGEAGFTYANLVALRNAGNFEEIARLFELPFHKPIGGKLPLGRIPLGIRAKQVRESRLDLARALASLTLDDGTIIDCKIFAEDPCGIIDVRGPGAAAILARSSIVAPAYGETPLPPARPSPLDYGGAADLGFQREDIRGGRDAGYVASGGGTFLAALARQSGNSLLFSAAIGSTAAAAGSITRGHLDTPIAAARNRHRDWWARYWKRSSVQSGDDALNRRWRQSSYHMGSAARTNGPPVPLQSPWTWDNDRLPAWKGDYHHDLNTQMTYWPVYTGNRPDQSANLIDWLWATRHQATEFTRSFFGKPGLNYPGTGDIANRPLGGWAAYSFSPTVSAWLLQHFDLHWQHFGGSDFLRTRAYPFALGVTTFLKAMLSDRPGRTGLFLPMNISPEINDNKAGSFFSEWTNFDLALVRYAFATAARMATAAGKPAEARAHSAMLGRLPLFALDADGGMAIAPGMSLEASHRHFSHLMAFYPLRLLDPATDPAAARILSASLARLERLGTKMWMGYSFAWLAALYAQAGRGGDAKRALATFERGFSGRNGFHTNGDRSKTGITAFPFSLFTLEGGNAAASAVQDMLLQSGPGWIRVFPATGASDASFDRLSSAAGAAVSAQLKGGKLIGLSLTAYRPLSAFVSGPGFSSRRVSLSLGQTKVLV